MKLPRFIRVALATLALGVSSATAQTITGTLLEVVPGATTRGTYDGVNEFDYNAGVFVFNTFEGFCVEPATPLSYGDTVTYSFADETTLANYQTIGRLLAAYESSTKTDLEKQAVQWAIWEVVLDGISSPSFSTGNSQLNALHNDVATRALQFLTDSASLTPADFYYLTNETEQDMVVLVPEPSVMGLGLLSCVVLLRRRRR